MINAKSGNLQLPPTFRFQILKYLMLYISHSESKSRRCKFRMDNSSDSAGENLSKTVNFLGEYNNGQVSRTYNISCSFRNLNQG